MIKLNEYLESIQAFKPSSNNKTTQKYLNFVRKYIDKQDWVEAITYVYSKKYKLSKQFKQQMRYRILHIPLKSSTCFFDSVKEKFGIKIIKDLFYHMNEVLDPNLYNYNSGMIHLIIQVAIHDNDEKLLDTILSTTNPLTFTGKINKSKIKRIDYNIRNKFVNYAMQKKTLPESLLPVITLISNTQQKNEMYFIYTSEVNTIFMLKNINIMSVQNINYDEKIRKMIIEYAHKKIKVDLMKNRTILVPFDIKYDLHVRLVKEITRSIQPTGNKIIAEFLTDKKIIAEFLKEIDPDNLISLLKAIRSTINTICIYAVYESLIKILDTHIQQIRKLRTKEQKNNFIKLLTFTIKTEV